MRVESTYFFALSTDFQKKKLLARRQLTASATKYLNLNGRYFFPCILTQVQPLSFWVIFSHLWAMKNEQMKKKTMATQIIRRINTNKKTIF